MMSRFVCALLLGVATAQSPAAVPPAASPAASPAAPPPKVVSAPGNPPPAVIPPAVPPPPATPPKAAAPPAVIPPPAAAPPPAGASPPAAPKVSGPPAPPAGAPSFAPKVSGPPPSAASTSLIPTNTPVCKPIPGDKDWPAHEEWIKEIPGVQKTDPPPKGTTRPDYVLNARTVADVEAAVKFASEKNIRLSVISSGHDFHGRCDAPNGLWLNVGNLKGCRVAESFTADANGTAPVNYKDDCVNGVNVIKPVPGRQAVVTFGVGATSQELYDATDKSGLMNLGAAASTVHPAGGFGQTAGHSPFSSTYGLAADNFVEFKVVTADGKMQVANARSNSQLFQALKGGGGGTFGVVVEATMNVFPTPKITVSKFWLAATDPKDNTSIFEPAAYLHAQFPRLNQMGVQGYYYVYSNGIATRFHKANSSIEEGKRIWNPILAALSSFPGMNKTIHQYKDHKSFKEYFDYYFNKLEGTPPGQPPEIENPYPRGITPMDSWLLGSEHLQSPNLAKAMQDSFPRMQNGLLRGHLVGGGKVNDQRVAKNSMVNPAWRTALVHLIGTGSGYPNVKPLRDLAPKMGSYANENAGIREPNWKNANWGKNYQRLLTIKNRYDPKGLFFVTPGVGADEFKFIDKRLCKMPSAKTSFFGFAKSSSTPPPESDNKNMVKPGGTDRAFKGFPKDQAEADAFKGNSVP